MSKSIRGSRSFPILRLLSLFSLLCLTPIACSQGDAASAPPQTVAADSEARGGAAPSPHAHPEEPSSGTTPATTTAASQKAKGTKAARHPNERPVPAFEGTTLAGTKLAMRDLLGARIVLFFFNPEISAAAPVSTAVNNLAAQSGDHNFRVVGIGVGSDASKLSRFVTAQELIFPVIDDSDAEITRQLRLQAPMAVIGIDADGYMSFGMGGFPADGDIVAYTEKELRGHLRLPELAESGSLYAYPEAPELGVIALSNGEPLTTKELEGRAAIVIFFLHTCPHCHKALEAIKGILASTPEAQKPRLVAISIQNAPAAIRKSLKDLGLDYFDPYLDPGGKATERWGVTGGVPVVTVLDPNGLIRHRSQGWNGSRDGGMLRMQVARAAGTQAPMLLDPKGYSGNDVCGVCHEQEYATWHYTKHATAFNTLVTHAADRRTDCIECHVVGFGETGGYDFARRPPHLENVGCESCHGRGGPHLSPGFVPTEANNQTKDYAQVCGTCHNQTHSLGFEYSTFQPRVSHKEIAALSDAERSVLLEGGGPRRDLLPTQSDYVGSNACQSCHTKEFETWQASPHGHAVATLESKDKAGEAECLQCHTTAYGRTGGFLPNEPVASQPDLARVGCESCHGPGGDHIGESDKRVGTILSLGDKCDSCVILKVCGTCHDDENDPGFQFKVEERIDAQRHGTIESAATRAGESAYFHHRDDHQESSPRIASESDRGPTADRALLSAAFDRLARRAGSSQPVGSNARPHPVADAS
jgi:peroxiredoxin